MALESGTYINSLNAANPASTDGLGQADDHIRLIKSAIKATFPNLDGPVTATVANLNNTTAIPSALTDLGISDGNDGQVLKTDGAGNFSFFTLPAGTTDTNYYVTGGSYSGTTLTLTRNGGLGNISISGLPAAITNNNQLTNGAGYVTAAAIPAAQSTNAAAVGTYTFALSSTVPSPIPGGTVSGSQLTYSDGSGTNNVGTSPSQGTWRLMAHYVNRSSLFVRVS
jgi:hypothetical protein